MVHTRGMGMLIVGTVLAVGCNPGERNEVVSESVVELNGRQYLLEQIGDVAIAQIYADGFEALELGEKLLVWHLCNAALAGRDIYYDQRYAHNLEMREVLEEMITHADNINPSVRSEIHRYTKLFWINTGPYNNLTARKFVLGVEPETFRVAAHVAEADGAVFPMGNEETLDELFTRLEPMFFDETFDPIVTNKTPGDGMDILISSANNLYDGVSMIDLVNFNEQYPLNSRLIKIDGRLSEEVYRIEGEGRYADELREIVHHLEAAVPYATTPMARALEALVMWYRTGEAEDRRAYDIAWVADQVSSVDTINGFTEVYMDARGA